MRDALGLLRRFGGVAMVMGVAAGIAAATRPAHSVSLGRAQTLLASLGSVMVCPTDCQYACSYPLDHSNYASQVGHNQGEQHTCAASLNACGDHTCGPDGPSGDDGMALLRDLAVQLEDLGFQSLLSLESQSNRIFVNFDRRSIQVLGCHGRVMLSIPLTEAQTEELTLSRG
jgi:hypothetical protein